MGRVYAGKGFTVEGEGIHSFRYSENNRDAILDGERLAGLSYNAPDFVLYSSTARWEDKTPVTEEERRRIVNRVSEALTHFGIKNEIE